MRTSAVILSSALLVATASATEKVFTPDNVPLATRNNWCTAQIETCTNLCNKNFNANTCVASDLTYSCTCASDGSTPQLAQYINTIPTFICVEIQNECVAANTSSATNQAICMKSNCGTMDPSKVTFSSTTSSSSAAATTSAASNASSPAASTTGASVSATAAPPKSGAARNIGLGAFALGMIGSVALLL